ncbi:hypothetical protein [Streptomyces odonnellii]|uniref:hypothetical protein n=1 Tax=Streptomyces odonnellii TaxID=1417980 RepID=UPI00062642DC|nr:hypothetical protein [Streptomyces odonnellii]
MPATLADLYTRYTDDLTAHAADRLATSGLDVEVDDITQGVWLWAAQQHRLPGWEELCETAASLIEEETERQRDRPETTAGLLPYGTPVWESDNMPVTAMEAAERPVVMERIDGTRGGVDAWYTARRDAAGLRTDAVIDQITVTVTKRGHWFRSDDVRNGNNDRVCRGCDADGHFAYILDYGPCTAPATIDRIRAVLSVPGTAEAAPRAATLLSAA